jgi:AcrR family transcriptional regulator
VTKAERTRNHILEATAPLFNTKGFAGTSLADLCAVTGLTKGAVYGNFKNKEELAAAAFAWSVSKVKSAGTHQIARQNTYCGKLFALLDFFADYVLNPPIKGGCPLLNTAVEADDGRPGIKPVVSKEIDGVMMWIAGMLDKAKKAGELRNEFSSKAYAVFFLCSIEGAIMYARVSASEEPMKTVIRNIKSIVNSLRNKNNVGKSKQIKHSR